MKFQLHEHFLRFHLKNFVKLKLIAISCTVLSLLFLVIVISSSENIYAQSVKDPNLVVETFVEGMPNATSMSFLNPENILVLQRDGAVRLVSDGQLLPKPIFEVPANSSYIEQGLLGIAVMNHTGTNSSGTLNGTIGENSLSQTVILYFTENVTGPEGINNEGQRDSIKRDKVYKYDWNDELKTLENQTLLLELPSSDEGYHNAGKLMIGPDKLLYGVKGDATHRGQLQNIKDGRPPDNTSIIFRINPNNGSIPASGNPLSSDPSNPLSNYYAYGIRNSFGLSFDPVTGNVWMTENGQTAYDEINLVKPGFNSGWRTIMGPISASNITEENLVIYEGAHYADPILSWFLPVGITDIEFYNSSILGERYQNNIFVGDYNQGDLYYFELNPNRTGLMLENIQDSVIQSHEEAASIRFGSGFGHITDLATGPSDGNLYILSHKTGTIYRIMPS